MSTKFSKGDVVQLKSGGPRMTVDDLDGNRVGCIWFDREGKPAYRAFDPATVVLASNE